jgi:hypothetical protein
LHSHAQVGHYGCSLCAVPHGEGIPAPGVSTHSTHTAQQVYRRTPDSATAATSADATHAAGGQHGRHTAHSSPAAGCQPRECSAAAACMHLMLPCWAVHARTALGAVRVHLGAWQLRASMQLVSATHASPQRLTSPAGAGPQAEPACAPGWAPAPRRGRRRPRPRRGRGPARSRTAPRTCAGRQAAGREFNTGRVRRGPGRCRRRVAAGCATGVWLPARRQGPLPARGPRCPERCPERPTSGV